MENQIEHKASSGGMGILFICLFFLVACCSFVGGFYTADGMSKEQITDFGKTKLLDDIYSCELIPKPPEPVTTTLSEFKEFQESKKDKKDES